MISCIAVDDEPLALDLISTYCARVEYLDLKKTFLRPSEARDYLDRFPVELLFLDIQMPDLSGIEFYRSLNMELPVIFTTAYSEYAVEGFNLNAVDYLLKPIRFSRFEQAVAKTKEYIDFINSRDSSHCRYLYIRCEYKLIKVPFSDILYIRGLDNYVRIFTDRSKSLMTRISMKEISEKLPSEMFARIHRSYIINLEKGFSYSNKKIHTGSKDLPVGISFENEVKKIFGII